MRWNQVVLSALALQLLVPLVDAQDEAAPAPGSIFVQLDTLVVGATVPCDSALYQLTDVPQEDSKAYTARSFGGLACTTSLDYEVPRAFVAESPITIRVVVACDAPAASAGVQGATASMRFIVLRNGDALTGNINLVGPNSCGSTPIPFEATADLGGEAFEQGDVLRINVIPFYTTGGAGDPNRSLHFKTGGATPSFIVVPDLVGEGLPDLLPPLFQNVTTPELRAGHNEAENLTQVEVYNWTSSEDPLLYYEANVTAGEVRITITDPLNETRLNQTVNATGNGSSPLGMPGNLTLRLEYVNFTGSLSLTLGPIVVPEVVEEPQEAPVEEERSGFFPLHYEEKPAPLGLLPVLLALAALAVALRRRR